jgi:flagellar motor component MotA
VLVYRRVKSYAEPDESLCRSVKMAVPPTSSHLPQETVDRDVLVRRKRRFWLWVIWLSGIGMVLPPAIGLLGAVFGMIGAFGAVVEPGEKGDAALSGGVSTALMATAFGLVAFVIAFTIFVAALTRFVMLPKLAESDSGR